MEPMWIPPKTHLNVEFQGELAYDLFMKRREKIRKCFEMIQFHMEIDKLSRRFILIQTEWILSCLMTFTQVLKYISNERSSHLIPSRRANIRYS